MSFLPSTARAVPALVAVAVFGVLSTGATFREDEIECDHAASRLSECCPDLQARLLDCSYSQGCGSETYDPWLSIPESECIRSRDCREIETAGICERVAERITAIEQDREESLNGEAGGDAGSEGFEISDLPPVCP